jgi:hypothetical protein
MSNARPIRLGYAQCRLILEAIDMLECDYPDGHAKGKELKDLSHKIATHAERTKDYKQPRPAKHHEEDLGVRS